MHEDSSISKSPIPVTGDSDLAFYRPCFNWSVILNKIFTSRDWTLEYDIDFIDTICVPANASKFFVTSYQKTLDTSLSLSGTSNLTGLDTNDFEKDVTTTSTVIDIGNISTSFRLRGSISVENQLSITIKATDGTGKINEKKHIVNTTDTEINITSIELSTNDSSNEVEIILTGSGDVTFDDTLLYTIIEEQKLGNISDNSLIGYKVKAYDNLPNKSQKDIYLDTMTIVNGIVPPDALNKNISLKSLNKITKLNSEDWSIKFEQKSEDITNKFNSFGQTNYLKYDNDDTIDSSLGEATFPVNNESLEDEKDYIKLNWSASNEVEINSFVIADLNIYDDNERVNEINERLLYFYNDSVTPTYTLARFNELDFRNLKDTYYNDYLASLERIRYIEGYANLNKLDVLGFDFMKLVYIEYFKSYFYVYKIEDYSPNQLTKVKLLKWL